MKGGLSVDDLVDGANHFVLNFGDGTNNIGVVENLKPQVSNRDAWYTLDGRLLDRKPAAKGIYIVNGRKYVMK